MNAQITRKIEVSEIQEPELYRKNIDGDSSNALLGKVQE